MAENKAKEGVVTLPSGLQYRIIKKGTGAIPKATDDVQVIYEGKTIDGKVFDSTAKHGTEFDTFNVGGLIKGWTEALQLMPVGSKWEIFIPYNLAYGERGAGRDIAPYSTLIFTLELKDIDGVHEVKPSTVTPSKEIVDLTISFYIDKMHPRGAFCLSFCCLFNNYYLLLLYFK